MDGWMDGWMTARRVTPRRNAPAFTLIELLVVVAVIGILAALLMPAVLRAMRSAATANCTSNLKQIGAGFMLYVKQYEGFMPPTGSPNGSPPYRYPYWYNNLATFVPHPDTFRCPAYKLMKVGYGLNHMWCGPDQIYGGAQAMNDRSKEITTVQNPSGTLIICDANHLINKDDPVEDWVETSTWRVSCYVCFPYDNEPGNPGKYTFYHTGARRPVPRHPGKQTNVLFFDMHVQPVPTRDILDDLWDDPGCIYDNDGHPPRQ